MIFGSFFTGIGGAETAIDMVAKSSKSECKTVFFCENAKNRYKILRKNFGAKPYTPEINDFEEDSIPIFPDIRMIKFDKANNKIFYNVSNDKKKEEYKECKLNIDLSSIDCGFYSFPCQPFSIAGKQLSDQDTNYLVDAVVDRAKELKTDIIICENVYGFVTLEMGLENWIKEMQNLGYNTEAVVLTSAGVGAPHKRERCFMIAYTDEIKKSMYAAPKSFNIPMQANPYIFNGRDVRNPGIEKMIIKRPSKLDIERLYATGNAINPFQIYPIIALVKHIVDYHKANPNQNITVSTKHDQDSLSCSGPFVKRLMNLDIYKTKWNHGITDWDTCYTPIELYRVPIQTIKFNQEKGYSWSVTPVAWDRVALYRAGKLRKEVQNLSEEEKEEMEDFIQNYFDEEIVSEDERPFRNPAWNEWLMGFPPGYTKVGGTDFDNIVIEDDEEPK